MIHPIPLTIVFEDQLSEHVMSKLAAQILRDGKPKFTVALSFSGGGNGYIKKNIKGFNAASKGSAYFVLTDLDNHTCAPELIKQWMNIPQHNNLILRVAVREVESWILADIEGFSTFTGVSSVHFPEKPDEIPDPKAELLRIIKKSRLRSVKEDVLPKNMYATIGPNYNGRLGEFVYKHWSVQRAAERSDSLARTVNALTAFELRYT